MKPLPPLEKLQELLRLSADSPTHLVWSESAGKKAGQQAGAPGGKYYRVRIDGFGYACHRIVWSLANGQLIDPALQIDHINGNPLDNRPANLRSCTNLQNHQNRPLTPTTGTMWDAEKRKWWAVIYKDWRRIRLGRFKTREEAHAAYLKAKETYHEFNPKPRDLVAQELSTTPGAQT